MLEKIGRFNDLSPKLRKKLEQRIQSYGKEVVYNFDISHENPDPEKYNGKRIWPSLYTLDPIVFDINDLEEEREGYSKLKKVGLITAVDKDGKIENYERIRVGGQHEGVVKLDLENPDDLEKCAIIELHPKYENGLFRDKRRLAVVRIVDEKKASEDSRKLRHQRATALRVATEMTEPQVREFAAAMNWNEEQGMEVLRDKVELQAEKYPDIFNDLVNSDKLKYQATVKNALSKSIVSTDPVNGRWFWTANNEIITVLPPNGTQNEIEQFAEFLRTNGKKGDQIYEKLKSLLKS